MNLITPGIGLIFWMTLTFLIVLFILGKWGWPVVIKGLKKREEEIKGSLEAAKKAQEEMANLKAGNEELLRKAQEERDNILKEAKEIKDKMINDAKGQAKEEADKILASTKESINYEKMKAISDIKNQIANFSIEIAEKVLCEQVKDKKSSEEIISKEIEKINLN